MDDFTLNEVRALIRLVKRDLRYRQANVSLVNLWEIEKKLITARVDKQARRNDNG